MTDPLPVPPPAAGALFGDRVAVAHEYARLLATDGVTRGLVGPREAPRLWERHVLNSAALTELVPERARLADVGSGAGLPGVPLALARPDLRITLVESMARRCQFLTEVVAALDLADRVTVVRARGEEYRDGRGAFDVVTARAVAPLDRLARWCLPLLRAEGVLLAIKGESAEAEATDHAAAVRRVGGEEPVVRRCGGGFVEPPTTVVVVARGEPSRGTGSGPSRKGGRPRRGRGGAGAAGRR